MTVAELPVNLLLRAEGEPVCVCEVQPQLGLVPGALESVREVFS